MVVLESSLIFSDNRTTRGDAKLGALNDAFNEALNVEIDEAFNLCILSQRPVIDDTTLLTYSTQLN